MRTQVYVGRRPTSEVDENRPGQDLEYSVDRAVKLIPEDKLHELTKAMDVGAREYITLVRESMRDLPTLARTIRTWEHEAEYLHYIPRRFIKSMCRTYSESIERIHIAGGADLPDAEFMEPALRNDFFVAFTLSHMLPVLRELSWAPASAKTQKRRRTK
jgi:hypothetical protein